MDRRGSPNDQNGGRYYQPPNIHDPSHERGELMRAESEEHNNIERAVLERKRRREEAIRQQTQNNVNLNELPTLAESRRKENREIGREFIQANQYHVNPNRTYQKHKNVPSADYQPIDFDETQLTNINKAVEYNLNPPAPTRAEPILQRIEKLDAFHNENDNQFVNEQNLRRLLKEEIEAEERIARNESPTPEHRHLPELLSPQQILAIEEIQRQQQILAPEDRLTREQLQEQYLESIDVFEKHVAEVHTPKVNMEFTMPTPLRIKELQNKIEVAKNLQLNIDKEELLKTIGSETTHNLLPTFDPNNPENNPLGFIKSWKEHAQHLGQPQLARRIRDRMSIEEEERTLEILEKELADQKDRYNQTMAERKQEELPRTFMFYYGILSVFVSTGFSRSIVAPFERLQIMRQVIPNSYDFTMYKNGMYTTIDYKAETPPLPPLQQGKDIPPRRFFPLFSPYHRLVPAIRHIRNHEGYLGLFRGNGSFLIRLAMFSCVQALCYEAFAKVYRVNTILAPYNMKPDLDDPSLPNRARELLRLQKEQQTRHLVALSLSTAVSTFICYPLELPRLYLALQMGPRKSLHYSGIYSLLKTILRVEGLRGIFRGVLASILTAVPLIGLNYYLTQFSAQALYLYFGTRNVANEPRLMEEYKIRVREARRIRKADPQLPLHDNQLMYTQILSTSFAVSTAGLILFPFDTVRRRIQLSGPVGRNSLYHGIITKPTIRGCVREIWRNEGVFGFYKGFSMLLLKTIPISAFTILVGAHGLRKSQKIAPPPPSDVRL